MCNMVVILISFPRSTVDIESLQIPWHMSLALKIFTLRNVCGVVVQLMPHYLYRVFKQKKGRKGERERASGSNSK